MPGEDYLYPPFVFEQVEELKSLLENVKDSYSDFVRAVPILLRGHEEEKEKVIEYLRTHPDAETSDALEYLEQMGI